MTILEKKNWNNYVQKFVPEYLRPLVQDLAAYVTNCTDGERRAIRIEICESIVNDPVNCGYLPVVLYNKQREAFYETWKEELPAYIDWHGAVDAVPESSDEQVSLAFTLIALDLMPAQL
jgi:hypothetical protein